MQERNEIDMDSPVQEYCVSWFMIRVASAGASLVIQSWNNHRMEPPC